MRARISLSLVNACSGHKYIGPIASRDYTCRCAFIGTVKNRCSTGSAPMHMNLMNLLALPVTPLTILSLGRGIENSKTGITENSLTLKVGNSTIVIALVCE
jgi:hypothetical protein